MRPFVATTPDPGRVPIGPRASDATTKRRGRARRCNGNVKRRRSRRRRVVRLPSPEAAVVAAHPGHRGTAVAPALLGSTVIAWRATPSGSPARAHQRRGDHNNDNTLLGLNRQRMQVDTLLISHPALHWRARRTGHHASTVRSWRRGTRHQLASTATITATPTTPVKQPVELSLWHV